MRASRGADRPSLLALNPRNPELSADRRTKLLAAFRSLDEDTQADLLELVETIAFRRSPGVDNERSDARDIMRQVHQLAGWEADHG
jgi:hypothetical protein